MRAAESPFRLHQLGIVGALAIAVGASACDVTADGADRSDGGTRSDAGDHSSDAGAADAGEVADAGDDADAGEAANAGGLSDAGPSFDAGPNLGEEVACTHYVDSVSPSEDWEAAVDIATPCTPLTAMANAQAGDTVCFRGGVYNPPEPPSFGLPAYNPAHSGTAAQPITFAAYPGEEALITDAPGPPPAGTNPAIGAFRADYIIWNGFTLRRTLDTGIEASAIVYFEEANHVVLTNCDAAGVALHQDHTNGVLIMVLHSTHVSIHNNRLHDMRGAENPIEATLNTGAMYIFDQEEIHITNNDIYNVYNAIQFKVDPNRIFAHHNHIWNCQNAAVFAIPETTGNTTFHISQNVIHDCPIALLSPDPPAVSHDLRFFNNSIYNSGPGMLAFIGSSSYQTHREAQVFNNILSADGDGSIFVRYTDGIGQPSYANHNTFHGSGQFFINYEQSFDELAAWTTATGHDADSITSDPLFVTPGGSLPEDYQLELTSPALTAGIDRQDHDNDGDTNEAIPMGAYIRGDEIIGAR